MILIEENFDGLVVESASHGKKTYLTGVFAEAGVRNRNGRVYDLKEMQREVQRINDMAKAGNHVLGELDHPSVLEVRLKNVSHKIVEMRMEGNRVIGKAEVLESHPNGQILKGLLADGVRVGVSTRGSGQVNESTGDVKNFGMVTVDAVATPSCRSAYPETIEEQLKMHKRGEIIYDLAESVIDDPMAQKYFQIEIRKFIESLAK